MTKFNDLPIYDATFDEEGTGIYCVSLVDLPAVKSDFLKFKKVKQTYSVQDESKHLVRGVVMRADFPIYRIDPSVGEFYIVFKKEQVRLMAEKYLATGNPNMVDTMHNNVFEDGVQMVQYFIKDTKAGINPEGFEDIEEGSLFAEFHITNEDIWQKVLDGTYRGFSIEVNPHLEKRKENKTNMSKIKRLFTAITKAMMQFNAVTTDKGILYYDTDDEDIAEGVAVYGQDDEGNKTEIEDGIYTTDDGKAIEIAEGKVKAINEVKPQEAEPEQEEPKEEEKPQEETPVETPAEPEPKEEEPKQEETPAEPESENEPEPKEEEEDKDAVIAELNAKIAELEAKIAELEGDNAKLRAMPVAKSAHEQAKEVKPEPSLLQKRLMRK